MSTRVGAQEAKTRLSEYLNRVRYGGERILIESRGKPMAALVGLEDLARLEAAAGDAKGEHRTALEKAGAEVSYPAGERAPRARRRVPVEGVPLSEQVIRDRR